MSKTTEDTFAKHLAELEDLLKARKFSIELISVGDLEVDKDIQRDHLDLHRIERMRAVYNEAALGVITVSRRNRVTNVVIDGMHRRQLVAEETDGAGQMLCHVYHGLTVPEEAAMFLALNYSTQPTALDKFRVRVRGLDPTAVDIDNIAKGEGWVIQKDPGNATIQAINSVERIYLKSIKFDREPNLLMITLRAVTRAWGREQDASSGVLLEGMAAFLSVYDDKYDFDSLVHKLRGYKNGPYGLLTNGKALRSSKQVSAPMAIAEIITTEYNKGKGSKALPAWSRRSW